MGEINEFLRIKKEIEETFDNATELYAVNLNENLKAIPFFSARIA